jgi:hypothetical protein
MPFLLLILNFAISWFNAWSVGRVWIESKMIGGFFQMTVWCGAIMSAYGFTWVYVTSLGVLAQSFSTFKGDDEEDDRALLLIVAIVLVAVGAGS